MQMNQIQKSSPESTSIALVTGAAQGLGFGIAKELASRGTNVIIGDIQLDKAKAVAKEFDGEAIPGYQYCPCTCARAARFNANHQLTLACTE